MTRPTAIHINSQALAHNLQQIKQRVGSTSIIAMVKANAYGCGIESVIPVLKGKVDAWGVACLEEALAIRLLDPETPCILFQGVFSPDEFPLLVEQQFHCVLHEKQQILWLTQQTLKKKLPIWLKIDTGMHRLGFFPEDLPPLLNILNSYPWVEKPLGLMTHLACADQPKRVENFQQLSIFSTLLLDAQQYKRSSANSAAILSFPESHFDAVRPGIMLYGVSPFAEQTGQELNLRPVMHFFSVISAIHMFPMHAQIGYGGTWKCERPSRIAIVAAGYGDGYPRHIQEGKVWIKGHLVPIIGRVSMDMMSIDITDFPDIQLGDAVELWGEHLPVEVVARTASTLAYELLSQISPRVRMQPFSRGPLGL